jgi:hypothetical protein
MAKQLDQQPKPTHEEIAARAFELFEKSGRLPGHDVENWLNAEKQLIAARRPAVEAKRPDTSAISNETSTTPRSRAPASRQPETAGRTLQSAIAGSRRT